MLPLLNSPAQRRALLRAALGGGLAWGLGGCVHTMHSLPHHPNPAAAPSAPSQTSLRLADMHLQPAHLSLSGWRDWPDPRSGRVWRIWLQMPEQAPGPQGYPVLLVLDGNAVFPLAAQWARLQQTRPEYVRGQPCVVIGIGHPSDALFSAQERRRDYTPPAPGAQPPEGGGDVLLDFVVHTLLPQWGAHLSLDLQRVSLFGHSLSALLVLHALFTRPQMCRAYYAASPSIWWHQAYVLQEQAQFERTRAPDYRAGGPLQTRLHVYAGSLEEPSEQARPSDAPPTGQRHNVRLQITRARTLAEQLAALRWPQLQAQFHLWPDLTHGDTMLPSLMQAVADTTRPPAWKDADTGLPAS